MAHDRTHHTNSQKQQRTYNSAIGVFHIASHGPPNCIHQRLTCRPAQITRHSEPTWNLTHQSSHVTDLTTLRSGRAIRQPLPNSLPSRSSLVRRTVPPRRRGASPAGVSPPCSTDRVTGLTQFGEPPDSEPRGTRVPLEGRFL